jgi:hypothetical protein
MIPPAKTEPIRLEAMCLTPMETVGLLSRTMTAFHAVANTASATGPARRAISSRRVEGLFCILSVPFGAVRVASGPDRVMQGGVVRVATDAATSLRLRQQLVTVASSFTDRPTEFVDGVMSVLVGAGLAEEPTTGPSLLSAQGAALCAVVNHPGATLRELGTVLGWSEGYVQKVLTGLVSGGFATRTRVGQRVVYRIARDEVLRHPDSRRIAALFAEVAADVDVEVLDSTGDRSGAK